MGLGSLPSFIFMPFVPAIKKKVGKKNMFYIFLGIAIVGMILLYIISKMGTVKENITLVYIAQFIKSTGVIVATGYMWALIPRGHLLCGVYDRSPYRRYRKCLDGYLL